MSSPAPAESAVSVRRQLRFWLTFEDPVTRQAYFRNGVALTALKYGGDVLLVTATTGRLWTPLDYLHSVPFLLSTKFSGAPPYLMPVLALWALPFLWAGVTLSMRRALDAGYSAWACLLFFVPYANYGLLLLLCLLPQAAETRPLTGGGPRTADHRLPSALLAIAAGLLLGLGMIAMSVALMQRYGLALFMGTPFVIGATTSFLFNRRYPASIRETFEVTALALAVLGGTAFLLGNEGVVCLLMAFPLGLAVGLMGAVLGRTIALRGERSLTHAALAVVVLPSSVILEREPVRPMLHEVRSSIEVGAAPEQVWNQVVAFPPLPEPTELVFRLGIAYPRYARIEGAGVGATRYCVFSTGPFVEPITRWEPGSRLSFDVVRSPAPLRELTPYSGIAPPHLEGYLLPRRGEFRLIPLAGGGTRLEGSTWYQLRLQPEGYWQLFSDQLIADIHQRVLRHIKRQAEESP